MDIFNDDDESNKGGGEAVGGNEYLLTEILRRIPVRSLVRFRCVCKSWCSQLSDSRISVFLPKSISGIFIDRSFNYEHLYAGFGEEGEMTRRKMEEDSNLVSSEEGEMTRRKMVDIRDSCHGLLLCSRSEDRCHVSLIYDYRLFVYNPMTQQLVTLDDPPYRQGTLVSANLAFDPRKSPHWKVVVIYQCFASYHNQFAIYSKETHTWWLSGNLFSVPYQMLGVTEFITRGVFSNGTIHWISFYPATSHSFRFHVETEERLPMPLLPISPLPPNDQRNHIGYFGESSGHLHLVVFKELRCTDTVFDVLEMKNDYSKWFVKFRVDLDRAITTPLSELGYASEYGRFSLLDFVRGPKGKMEQDESYMVLYVRGKLLSYNFKDNTLRKLWDLDLPLRPFFDDDDAVVHYENHILRFSWQLVHRYIQTPFPV